MPAYEYKCEACEHEWEEIQRISDEPTRVCPKCGAEQVKRLIGKTTFALRGSGWYRDGYNKS